MRDRTTRKSGPDLKKREATGGGPKVPDHSPERSSNSGSRGAGRSRTGKRSNPDYRQVSAWVQKRTYEQVTNRLFLKENRREFSDLVQSLLEEWLTER